MNCGIWLVKSLSTGTSFMLFFPRAADQRLCSVKLTNWAGC